MFYSGVSQFSYFRQIDDFSKLPEKSLKIYTLFIFTFLGLSIATKEHRTEENARVGKIKSTFS